MVPPFQGLVIGGAGMRPRVALRFTLGYRLAPRCGSREVILVERVGTFIGAVAGR